MSQRVALFGSGNQPQPKHLLQFKAGKMTISADNWVRADSRKGWGYLYLSSDSKLHFCWIDRRTRLVEDDLIISTKNAEFKRVPQCTTGRVYLLNIKNSKKFFIWMQEPKESNDSNVCSRMNEFIKSPPPHPVTSSVDWANAPEMSMLLALGANMASGLSSESDISTAQATLGRHTASIPPSSRRPRATTTTVNSSTAAAASSANTGASAAGGRIRLDDLHSILSSLPGNVLDPNIADILSGRHGSAASAADTRAAASAGSGEFGLNELQSILSSLPDAGPSTPNIDLNDAVNIEAVRGLLSKPEVQERLLPHLPPPVEDTQESSEDDASRLAANIRSPQFKNTLQTFSAAFQTGELAPVLAQFNLGSKAEEAARHGDLTAFSQALQSDSSAVGGPSTAKSVSKISSPEGFISKKPKRDETGEDSKKKDKDDEQDGDSGPAPMETD